MDWDKVKQCECPMCGSKLQFRKKGSVVNTITRSRDGVARNTKCKEDYYFCFPCRFQIRSSRVKEISKDIEQEDRDFARKLGLKLLA